MTKNLPDPQWIRKLLRYDAETGKLFWLPRPREMFTSDRIFGCWNARYAGQEAFTAMTHGYFTGAIMDKSFRAHRVIWAIQTGAWPKNEIDHINRDRADNRWSNLRQATREENARNQGSVSKTSSKYRGVSWSSRDRVWRAQIQEAGRNRGIGSFRSEIEAALAYDAEAFRLFGEFACLNFLQKAVA
jgi:hypothetical protein